MDVTERNQMIDTYGRGVAEVEQAPRWRHRRRTRCDAAGRVVRPHGGASPRGLRDQLLPATAQAPCRGRPADPGIRSEAKFARVLPFDRPIETAGSRSSGRCALGGQEPLAIAIDQGLSNTPEPTPSPANTPCRIGSRSTSITGRRTPSRSRAHARAWHSPTSCERPCVLRRGPFPASCPEPSSGAGGPWRTAPLRDLPLPMVFIPFVGGTGGEPRPTVRRRRRPARVPANAGGRHRWR